MTVTSVETGSADFYDAVSACSHPQRLRGVVKVVDRATGEAVAVFDSASMPDGVVYVPCGNRRASVCPSCSLVYKRDAWHIVRDGIIEGRPSAFVTLTADSFGLVHVHREKNGRSLPCRARRDHHRRVCPHGRDTSCGLVHGKDEPVLGRPLCPDCYDYRAAVLFNASAGKLFRLFKIYLDRELARLGGITLREFRKLVRVEYAKVAEYQKRGAVHFHGLFRLDSAAGGPPPPEWTAELLEVAVRAAAARIALTVPVGDAGRAVRFGFGEQVDVRQVLDCPDGELTGDMVANYIAKYSVKGADVPGLSDHQFGSIEEIRVSRCSAHHKRLAETAWRLGLRKWAHMLGFGGHFLTKSRSYSAGFGLRRAARRAFREAQRYDPSQLDPWSRPVDESTVVFIGSWTYAGSGYVDSDSYSLALMSADNARAD